MFDAERLAKDNEGILPCSSDLKKMGYSALARDINKNPDRYSNLSQASFFDKAREKHLKTAKELINKHGEIPTTYYLSQNGYKSFSNYISKHPELIEEIENDTKKKNS